MVLTAGFMLSLPAELPNAALARTLPELYGTSCLTVPAGASAALARAARRKFLRTKWCPNAFSPHKILALRR
jgi:hypothetical protein